MKVAREGFVLVAALWMCVIVSALTVAATAHFRARTATSTAIVESGVARRSAFAGLERALRDAEELLNTAEQGDSADLLADPWRFAGRASGCFNAGELEYCVAAVPAEAVLNINTASEQEVRRFLEAAHVPTDSAFFMAAAIADWVDADDLRRSGGAEGPDYPIFAAPGNRPFSTLTEVGQVRGFDPPIMRMLTGMMSTRGGRQVHLALAPRAVLATLPAFGHEVLDAVERLRRGGHFELAAILEAVDGPARDSLEWHMPELVSRTTNRVTEIVVRSVGHGPGRATAHIEALLVQNAGRPRITQMVIH